MRIDLTPPDVWSTLSERYRAQLPFDGKETVHVQIYAGYRHALQEITQSLSKLLSHKKTVAIASQTEPSFESVSVGFSEEGLNLKALIQGPQCADGLTEVSKDLLFTLVSEDDPVTGRLYDFSAIDSALKDQRVFRIKLSHSSFRVGPIVRPAPYEIRILSLSPDRALMVAGERCRVTPQLAARLPWSLSSHAEIVCDLSCAGYPFSEAIQAFEKKLPQGFSAYFQSGEARVYDRAVIWSPEFDGSAVIETLAQLIGAESQMPGLNGQLESASACRWTSPRLSDWLIKRGEKEEVLRGLVMISGEVINPDLPSKLERAAQTLRKLQNG